jgi:hypothetical protein
MGNGYIYCTPCLIERQNEKDANKQKKDAP